MEVKGGRFAKVSAVDGCKWDDEITDRCSIVVDFVDTSIQQNPGEGQSIKVMVSPPNCFNNSWFNDSSTVDVGCCFEGDHLVGLKMNSKRIQCEHKYRYYEDLSSNQ